MKKYVFSYISFFDNILTSKVIESDLSAIDVACLELEGMGWEVEKHSLENIDKLKQFAFDCDSMFEIIEV